MFLVTSFKQTERLTLVAEPRINYARPIEIHISVRGQILEFLGDPQRISPPAGDSANPTERASNELVPCCCDFVLIGNLVVFGKGLRIHSLHRVCQSYHGMCHRKVWIEVERLLELSNRLIVSSRYEIDVPLLGNYIR
jgi:hypothetical protein